LKSRNQVISRAGGRGGGFTPLPGGCHHGERRQNRKWDINLGDR
jgi:hypothetical protein